MEMQTSSFRILTLLAISFSYFHGYFALIIMVEITADEFKIKINIILQFFFDK